MRNKYKYLFLIILLSGLTFPSYSADSESPRSLPFSREENEDGSKWVWFVMSQANFKYKYVTAKGFPDSGYFLEVKNPQAGDVAWWQGYMAIIDPSKKAYMTAENYRAYESVERLFGKPKYFRFITGKNQ